MSVKSKFTRYKPKRWHPEFDLIVIGSISGKDNAELAKIFGYTPQHISNILSTDEARIIKEKARVLIGEQLDSDIKDRLGNITNGALKSLEQFFVTEREERYKASPFNFVDRAMRFMERGNAPSSNVNHGTVNNFQINAPSNAIVDRMATALERSMKAGLNPDLEIKPDIKLLKDGTRG